MVLSFEEATLQISLQSDLDLWSTAVELPLDVDAETGEEEVDDEDEVMEYADDDEVMDDGGDID